MKIENIVTEDRVSSALKEMEFKTLSPVQEKTIPVIKAGKDVIVQSETGSGKTAAFGIPLIELIENGKGIQALVLVPTRELAEQTVAHMKQISKYKKIPITAVYGGVAIGPQVEKLKTACVVVGTPGRILDHAERGTLNFSKIKYLVFDEADRMFDMGFIDDMKKVLGLVPHERQTLLFSATLNRSILELVGEYMNDPVEISTKEYVENQYLTQVYYDVQKNQKFSLLLSLLKSKRIKKAIVFCNTRREVTLLSFNLRKQGINAWQLHGGLTQKQRNQTMEKFRRGDEMILVASDVAARGIDITGIEHIFNYDVPRDPKEYVHRIGRTARMGSKGEVVNIVCEKDYMNFNRITSRHSFKIQKEKVPKLERVKFNTSDVDFRRPQRKGRTPAAYSQDRRGYGRERKPVQRVGGLIKVS